MPNVSSSNNSGGLAALGFLATIGIGLYLVTAAFGSRRKGETITEEEAEEELAAIKEEEEEEPEIQCRESGCTSTETKKCPYCDNFICERHEFRCSCCSSLSFLFYLST